MSPITAHLTYYIPDRYTEGYGISIAGMDYAVQQGASLVIAVDCGIRDHAAICHAAERGIDVVVCDHHLPAPTLPPAIAILNPLQPDCPYPYKALSGCGIAFKLAQAYCQHNDLPNSKWLPLLDLVAVSIACDIVPITGENRILAHAGLHLLAQSPRLGLQALLRLADRTPPLAISDLVFGLGPLINAAGRIGNASDAVRLLLATDEAVAHQFADHLQAQNGVRRDIEKRVTALATEQFAAQPNNDSAKTIVVCGDDWHKGVLGIVAARLVEQYHRSAIVLTRNGDLLSGSARAVAGFDLYSALTQCADLLVSYGGHQHAAGLTLHPEQLPAFCEKLEAIATETISPADLLPTVQIDALLPFDQITPTFWNILKQFAPFGPQNMRPVFLAQYAIAAPDTKVVKNDHLQLYARQNNVTLKGVGFGMAGHYPALLKAPFHLCYVLQENNWQGNSRIEFQIKDLHDAASEG